MPSTGKILQLFDECVLADSSPYRSYIARMMGELLEDVDPCETVEYVLPLLNGFAMDEGESASETRHIAN